MTSDCMDDRSMKPSPSPAATQQNEFEKYPELARHIEHFANTATNVSLKDWWALLDALNASLIAASRGTRALTEDERVIIANIKLSATGSEAYQPVFTASYLAKRVLPIISRLTGEPRQSQQQLKPRWL